jgi:Na+-transporting methylmalonyl-CoA/oxaloacetate decarboxylase gamma subunit
LKSIARHFLVPALLNSHDALAMADARASARRRAVLAAVITLFLLASVSFLLSATATSSASAAANSPASRLAIVQRHAEDHAAVLAAYTAHARHLSAASASQTDAFLSVSSRLSALAARLSLSTVGALEKEIKAQVKRARSLAGGA